MSRIAATATAVFLIGSFVHAQAGEHALSAQLKYSLSRAPSASAKVAADARLRIVVQGEEATLRPTIESVGGHVGTLIGDIATASIPVAALSQLSRCDDIHRIEQPLKLRPSNDAATRSIGADAVQAGRAPLPSVSLLRAVGLQRCRRWSVARV